MSHFSLFIPIKANVKFANGNMGHSQEIGILLFHFPRCPIIYTVVPVNYCPGHPSNNISLGGIKFYFVFQKITSEHFEHCDFVYPQCSSWRSLYKTRKKLGYLKINIVKINLLRKQIYFGSNFIWPLIWNLSRFIYQWFGHIFLAKIILITIKVIMKGLTSNIPYLYDPVLFSSGQGN